ncbi:hypothetical protein MA16_Dca003200 [Dendrobium catenatum]|uniref:Piezo-type mechanosensitive ion channel homolog domain-containing protein n=1 Tax=Dendrobium catenatum TaxID=906689 RepID=A0A2I0XC25_9ASPA|nr:hypothetical protein MA16_Dca003200 [Dendrobium catenatum]
MVVRRSNGDRRWSSEDEVLKWWSGEATASGGGPAECQGNCFREINGTKGKTSNALWSDDGIQPQKIESEINRLLKIVNEDRCHANIPNSRHSSSRVRIQSIERSQENSDFALTILEVMYVSPLAECPAAEWYWSLTPASDVATELLLAQRITTHVSSWDFIEISVLLCFCAIQHHGLKMLVSLSFIVQHTRHPDIGFSMFKAGLNKSVLLSVYAARNSLDGPSPGTSHGKFEIQNH